MGVALFEVRYRLMHYSLKQGHKYFFTLEEKNKMERFVNVTEEQLKHYANVTHPWFWEEILVRVQ